MIWGLEIGLGLVAASLALPVVVLVVECLAALTSRSPADEPEPDRSAASVRTAVLIPAHDEAANVGDTVTRLRPQLGPSDDLIVIADNCGDETAQRAREAGAEVIERADPDHRGKGYAIAFGLRHLESDPPDVVVLVDADCRLSENGVRTLALLAAEHDRPVQGEYLIAAPENPTSLSALSGLAFLVRNRVRPRGLRRLGLPCHLGGSGMAFPWRVLRNTPSTESNLVEDLVMGIEMALMGHAPLSCPAVQVSSELPAGDDDARGQRRRWEHGQLATLVGHGPRLWWRGIRDLRVDLLGLGLDLIVPPLALLATLLALVTLLSGLLALIGGSVIPLGIALGGVGGLCVAVLAAWFGFGREALPVKHVLALPAYVLWKLPLYLSLVLRRRQRTWERTPRRQEGTGRGSGPA